MLFAIQYGILIFGFLRDNAPAIVEFVKTAETAFGVSAAGEQKFAYALGRVQVLYQGSEKLAAALPWEKAVPFIAGHIDQHVAGLYPKKAAA